MVGIYPLNSQGRQQLKTDFNWQVIKMFLWVYSVFLLLFLLQEPDQLFTFCIFSVTYFFALGISLIIRNSLHYSIYNTIIILEEDKIIRKGDGLMTVHINFHSIRTIKDKSYGLIVIDHDFSSSLNYYLSRDRLSAEPGIIFIPAGIPEYGSLKNYLMTKLQSNDIISI